jgi:hypothetical protein
VSPNTNTKPEIAVLSRREFLSLATAATGGAVLATEAVSAWVADGEGEQRRFRLPEEPNQNPAFMARSTADGGLLVWTHDSGGEFRGYRMNATGRSLWRLCDGSRSLDAIGAEHARRHGRPAPEGAEFVNGLLELGVIVSGGWIVPDPAFPRPPDGGCYHCRIEPDDPVSS